MLKVFESFAGIGTQRMALRNLGIDHLVVAIAEIDKFAIKSYEAIHGEVNNLGDISKIAADDIPDHDLFTYSFPCQDISIAGKQGGLEKGSDTRSSLLWECNRVIESKKPKYLMLENVKNLVGKKFKPYFDEWLDHLEGLGYTNYWQVLNAKDYGVPQNRERVFVISILGEHEPYVFPEKFELTSRLKDVLEDEVDEKFYLSEEKMERLTLNIQKKQEEPVDKINQIAQYDTPTRTNSNRFRTYDENGLSPTIGTMGGGGLEPQVVEPKPKLTESNIIGHLNTSNYEQSDRVYNVEKEAPTISARDYKGAKQILEPQVVEGIPIKNTTKKGYLLAQGGDGIDLAYPDSKTRRGRVQKSSSQTVTTSDNLGAVDNFRIRKLTSLECWRLMGCSDEDFYKAQEVNSNTQLYKQAGNAIVVDVLEAIFRNMF